MAEVILSAPEMHMCEPCRFRSNSNKVQAVKFCQVCQEPLCLTCADVHRSSKATRAHLLVGVSEKDNYMAITQDCIFQMCKKHPEKELEYFCIETGNFYCSTCIFFLKGQFDGRSICDLSTAGKKLVAQKFDETIFLDLNNVIEVCRNEESKINSLKDECIQNRTSLQKKMDETREKMIATFSKYEKQILEKADKEEKQQIFILEAELKRLAETRQTFENNKELLQTILENSSAGNIFRFSCSLIKQIDELKKRPLRQTTSHINHTLNLSPGLYSFIADCVPALIYSTKKTIQEPMHFPPVMTSKQKFTEIIKSTTVQQEKSESKEFTLGSADGDTEEQTIDCQRGTDTTQFNNLCDTNTADCTLNRCRLGENTNQAFNDDVLLDKHIKESSEQSKEKETRENHTRTGENRFRVEDKTHSNQMSAARAAKAKSPTCELGSLQIFYSLSNNLQIKGECHIRGAAIAHDGCLVISECHSSRLHLIRPELKSSSFIRLTAAPGRIAVLDESSVAVCMPKYYHIAICCIKPKLEFIRHIKTSQQPNDISAIDSSKLLVSMISDNKQWALRILSTEGQTLKTIARTRKFLDASFVLFQRVEGANGLLYLQCCKSSKTLYCFDEDGNDIFKYGVVIPSAMCVDYTKGTVYIIEPTGILHVLSRAGQLILKFETGIQDAYSLAYNALSKKIMIFKKQSCNVTMFDVKEVHPSSIAK